MDSSTNRDLRDSPALLEVRGLSFSYHSAPSSPVLNDVNWRLVADNEAIVCGVVGASGSGKTTFLKLLAGLLPESQGEILFRGLSIASFPAWQRRFALLFQERTLFPGTVRSNLEFPLKLLRLSSPDRIGEVRRVLSLVGMEGFERRHISELSGGQRQRVELARAILSKPRMLLLDEPFAQLDLELRLTLAPKVCSVARAAGVPCIYVTHDAAEATAVSDVLCAVTDGTVTTPRAADTILADPCMLGELSCLSPLNALEFRHQSSGSEGQVYTLESGESLIVRFPTYPTLTHPLDRILLVSLAENTTEEPPPDPIFDLVGRIEGVAIWGGIRLARMVNGLNGRSILVRPSHTSANREARVWLSRQHVFVFDGAPPYRRIRGVEICGNAIC